MNDQQKPVRRKPSAIYIILIACFALVFLVCAVKLGSYWIGSNRAENEYDELSSIKNSIQNSIDQSPGSSEGTSQGGDGQTPNPDSGETPAEKVILPQLAPIYQLNNDMVGWIHVPGTKIDYPVMQTPETPDFYINHNFYKKASDWGAIYAREQCDVFAPCDNVILYGHHMDDGSMFASLMNYGNKSFWEQNKALSFDSLYEQREYQIWAVFKTSAVPGKGFSYHLYNNFKSESVFQEFVEQVQDLAFYDTGIVPEYGDKFVTLSTCEYTLEDGRFVVVAVRKANAE